MPTQSVPSQKNKKNESKGLHTTLTSMSPRMPPNWPRSACAASIHRSFSPPKPEMSSWARSSLRLHFSTWADIEEVSFALHFFQFWLEEWRWARSSLRLHFSPGADIGKDFISIFFIIVRRVAPGTIKLEAALLHPGRCWKSVKCLLLRINNFFSLLTE